MHRNQRLAFFRRLVLSLVHWQLWHAVCAILEFALCPPLSLLSLSPSFSLFLPLSFSPAHISYSPIFPWPQSVYHNEDELKRNTQRGGKEEAEREEEEEEEGGGGGGGGGGELSKICNRRPPSSSHPCSFLACSLDYYTLAPRRIVVEVCRKIAPLQGRRRRRRRRQE
jgi:hypothetical protein